METYYADHFLCFRCGSDNKNQNFKINNCSSRTCNHCNIREEKCCNNKQLRVLNNRSPSLDIICNKCGNRLEVKSKCLSVKHLPMDLILPHGSFSHYEKRQAKGLDFVIIIYGIKRQTKQIFVRKFFTFQMRIINKDDNVISIIHKNKSQLSKIIVPDRLNPKIISLPLPNDRIIDFKERVDNIKVI